MREDMVAQTEKEVAAASGAYNACVAMQDQAEAELALFSATEIKKQTKLSAFFASAMSCVSLPPLANPLAATRGRAGPVAAGSRTPAEQQQHARRAEKNAALLKLRRAREAADRARQALMHCRARLHRITPAGSAVLQNSGDSPAVSQTGEASSSLVPRRLSFSPGSLSSGSLVALTPRLLRLSSDNLAASEGEASPDAAASGAATSKQPAASVAGASPGASWEALPDTALPELRPKRKRGRPKVEKAGSRQRQQERQEQLLSHSTPQSRAESVQEVERLAEEKGPAAFEFAAKAKRKSARQLKNGRCQRTKPETRSG
jgi:hypothetical protein